MYDACMRTLDMAYMRTHMEEEEKKNIQIVFTTLLSLTYLPYIIFFVRLIFFKKETESIFFIDYF